MSSVIVEETFGFSCIVCGVWQKPIPQSQCLSLRDFGELQQQRRQQMVLMNQVRLFQQVVSRGLAFIRENFHFGELWELQGCTDPEKAERSHHHPTGPVCWSTGPEGSSEPRGTIPCSPGTSPGLRTALPQLPHWAQVTAPAGAAPRPWCGSDTAWAQGPRTVTMGRVTRNSDHGHGDHSHGDHGNNDCGQGDHGPGDHGAEHLSSGSTVPAAILPSWSMWHQGSHAAGREQWGKRCISIWEAFLYSAEQKLLQKAQTCSTRSFWQGKCTSLNQKSSHLKGFTIESIIRSGIACFAFIILFRWLFWIQNFVAQKCRNKPYFYQSFLGSEASLVENTCLSFLSKQWGCIYVQKKGENKQNKKSMLR